MSYNVNLSDLAKKDLENIANYYIFDLKSPDIALSKIRMIRQALTSLATMPERHGLVDDAYLAAQGYRKFPIDKYIVFYIFDAACHSVWISRIVHERRQWIDLL